MMTMAEAAGGEAGQYVLLTIYLTLAIGVSFLCSLLEATLLSVTHSHVAMLEKSRPRVAAILGRFKERIDRPIIAILTLNTVAHTAGAAGVGAQIFDIWGEEWIAVGSAVLTFAILVFSEVIPKTIGAAYWKQLAPFSAYTTRALVFVIMPVVWTLELISKLLSSSESVEKVTREELLVVAEMGRDEGVLRKRESRIIKNLLLLNDIQVKDVMTPRNVVQFYQADRTVDDVMKETVPLPFSRIPVYGENVDDVKGVVFRHVVLEASVKGEGDQRVGSLMQAVHAIPETASVSHALEEFIRRQEHMLLVVDEYGGTEGIVTLEDAIETLLGVEIIDETDNVEDMRKHALDLWEKRKSRYTRYHPVKPPTTEQ